MPNTPSVPEQKTPQEILEKEDQADSGPDKDNPVTRSKAGAARTAPDPQDAHIGAREDQVSDTPAPAGEAFEDEPRQG